MFLKISMNNINRLLALAAIVLLHNKQLLANANKEHGNATTIGHQGGEDNGNANSATTMMSSPTFATTAAATTSDDQSDALEIAPTDMMATPDNKDVEQQNSNTNIMNDDDNYQIAVNDEARLVQSLITRYKGYGLARPVAQVNKTLDVSLLFVINEFLGIEELTGIMKVSAVIVAIWQDDLLRWDPNNYSQLKAMPMRTKDVFLPTIVKDGNGGTQASIFMTGSGQNDRDINSMVWVEHTGRIEAKVTNLYATSCKLDLAEFPFDRQTCQFMFKSWRFSDKRITLHQAKGQKVSEHITDSLEVNINANANWMMESVTSEDGTLVGAYGENYSAITYTVIAVRRSDYYTWNVLLPSFAMAVLLLATFFMPFGPDRSMFCITLVLTMNIFQQALNSKLPVTSGVIPYVRMTTTQVAIGIVITIESAFIWWLAAKDKRCAVPNWLRFIVPALRKRVGVEKEKIAKALSLNKNNNNSMAIMKQHFARGMTNKGDLEQAAGMLGNHRQQDGTGNDMLTSASRCTSIASFPANGLLNTMGDQVAIANGDEFIIWGEWIEVAQMVDVLMLISTIASMFLFPIYFYSNA